MTTQAFEYPQADALAAFDEISFVEEPAPDLSKSIDDAFIQLRLERNRLHDAQTATALAQAAYDDCKRDMFLGGHVIGKNEAERESKLQDLLRVQTKQLRDAGAAERTARLYFDIARDEVERVKLLAALVGE